MKPPKSIKRILFVCYGNLCRSVLAEALAKKLKAERGLDHLALASAGIGALPDYQAPQQIVDVAKERGLDVTEHRSRTLSPSLIDWADLVLVMESYMMDKIHNMWPEKDADKVFLLGSFALGDTVVRDIDDPYGGSPEDFQRCFSEIEASVQGVVRTLVSGSGPP
jgi:protein-tyrosine-phosphatase